MSFRGRPPMTAIAVDVPAAVVPSTRSTGRARLWTGRVLTSLVTAFLLFDVTLKRLRPPMVVEGTASKLHAEAAEVLALVKDQVWRQRGWLSRKAKFVLVFRGEVTKLEVRVRVDDAEAEAWAKRVLEDTSYGWGW